jgi:CRP/FNR family transcriptional regulator, cyclic AMP receptor protein
VPFRKKRTSDDEVIGRLSQVAFFEGFTDKELARVAELVDEVEAEEGYVLTDQGRPGLECYVIVEGEAGVFVGENRIATLKAGETVGEMALIDHGPRSATVRAESPMQLLALDAKRFRTLLDEMPKAQQKIMTEINRRLREQNLNQ